MREKNDRSREQLHWDREVHSPSNEPRRPSVCHPHAPATCRQTDRQTSSHPDRNAPLHTLTDIQRSRLPAGNNESSVRVWLLNDCGQVAHTKQYNLVPVSGRWRSATGKVTVGLASQWSCVTDQWSTHLHYTAQCYERKTSTPRTLQ